MKVTASIDELKITVSTKPNPEHHDLKESGIMAEPAEIAQEFQKCLDFIHQNGISADFRASVIQAFVNVAVQNGHYYGVYVKTTYADGKVHAYFIGPDQRLLSVN